MNQVFFVTFYFSIYHSTISRFFLFVGNPVLRVLSNYSRKAARYVASNTSRSFGKLVRIIIVATTWTKLKNNNSIGSFFPQATLPVKIVDVYYVERHRRNNELVTVPSFSIGHRNRNVRSTDDSLSRRVTTNSSCKFRHTQRCRRS
jgi:hypothetical protein